MTFKNISGSPTYWSCTRTGKKIKAMSTVCTHSQSKQRDGGVCTSGGFYWTISNTPKKILSNHPGGTVALGSRERHILCTLLTAALQSQVLQRKVGKHYTHRQEQGNNQTGELTLHRKNTVQVSTETINGKLNKNWDACIRIVCFFALNLFLWGFFPHFSFLF